MLRSLFVFLFFSHSLWAFYVGNPAYPGIMNNGLFTHRSFFKFTSGYIGDYTSNKRFIAEQTDPSFDPNQSFKEFGLHSQLATVSFIFLERLQIYGTAGGTKERPKLKHPSLAEVSTALLDFESNYHFSWSTGARIVLLQWGQTFFSTEFSYFAVPSSSKSFFKYLNRLQLPIESKKQHFHLDEWQVSAGLSSKFWIFTPYAGMKYLNSHLHVNSGPDTGTINYHNKVKIGYFYGLTLSLTGKFHINAERRVRDEFAYSISTVAVF